MEKKIFQAKEYIKEFREISRQYSNSIPDCITLDFKKHSGHLVFAGIIHGNEVGSLPSLLRTIKELINKKTTYFGKVSFILGNPDACFEDKRFLDQDLNRSFNPNIKDLNSLNKEGKRAQEIMKILNSADVFIDFHQTIMPCLKPFYIFELEKNSYFWARALGGAKTFVTRKKGASFSSLGMCSDEYVRSLNKIGITIELGEQGFDINSRNLSYCIMQRALNYMDSICLQNRKIEKIATKNLDFQFLEIKHREKFTDPANKLMDNLKNFQFFKQGDKIGYDKKNNPISIPVDGYLLFPKYPTRNSNGEALAPLPGEIFVLAQDIDQDKIKKWIKE